MSLGKKKKPGKNQLREISECKPEEIPKGLPGEIYEEIFEFNSVEFRGYF